MPISLVPIRLGAPWLVATARTIGAVVSRPFASTQSMQEPVRLSPWVAFLLTLAAPSWLALILHELRTLTSSEGPRIAFSDPRWLDAFLGAAGVDALNLWTLAVAPLGLMALFFCAGTLAHLLVLLTGHSSRTLGATLRATAMSWVPLLLIGGPLELALRVGWLGSDSWVWGVLGAGCWSFGLWALGLSRAHHTALIRGAVAVPLPWLLTMGVLAGRAALSMAQAPFP